jgi:hypothetical protein
MCEGSIHVAHRQAKAKESLVVRSIPHHGLKGYYPADADSFDSKLVCVRGVTKNAVIHELLVTPNQYAPDHYAPTYFQQYIGQKNLKVTLLHAGYADWIVFGDDNVSDPNKRLALGYVADGVRVDIGIPAITGDKGVDVLRAALVEHDKVSEAGEAVTKAGLSMTREAIRSRARRAAAKAKAQVKV